MAEIDHIARSTPLLILPLAMLAAGCGGNPSGGDGVAGGQHVATAPIARGAAQQRSRDFIMDAKRICAQMAQRLPTLNAATPPTERQLLLAVDVWDDTVAQLRKLDPPAAEEARFGRMLSHFENAIRAARALPGSEGESALAPVAAMAAEGQRGAAIAYDYGVEICSLFPPAPSRTEFERYVLDQAKKEGGLLGTPPTGRPKPKPR